MQILGSLKQAIHYIKCIVTQKQTAIKETLGYFIDQLQVFKILENKLPKIYYMYDSNGCIAKL